MRNGGSQKEFWRSNNWDEERICSVGLNVSGREKAEARDLQKKEEIARNVGPGQLKLVSEIEHYGALDRDHTIVGGHL